MEKTAAKSASKEKKFDKAIEIAAQAYLQKGVDEVKMTDIADKSGVGVATLYRHFGTKTNLTIQAMTYLWEELKKMFAGVFESEPFLKQTGLKQVTDLMRMFLVLYEAHPAFMRLLGEFDQLIITEKIPRSELVEYDRSVFDFYPIVERSYMTGLSDGTVRDDIDFKLIYLAASHSLMELGKKLLRGELVPSDDFSAGEKEMEIMIEAVAAYIRKD